MERYYIIPQYRNKGIGSYLLNNLDKILNYFLNVNIKCFIIYPNPQVPINKEWKDIEDKKSEMKKLMEKIIKNAGYKQINKSGYYAINYFS